MTLSMRKQKLFEAMEDLQKQARELADDAVERAEEISEKVSEGHAEDWKARRANEAAAELSAVADALSGMLDKTDAVVVVY